MSWHLEASAGRVILRKVDNPNVTRGGLVIPETATKKHIECVVVSVGPPRAPNMAIPESLKQSAQPFCRTGDRVVVSFYAGVEVSRLGDNLLVVEENDILAVIRDGPSEIDAAVSRAEFDALASMPATNMDKGDPVRNIAVRVMAGLPLDEAGKELANIKATSVFASEADARAREFSRVTLEPGA